MTDYKKIYSMLFNQVLHTAAALDDEKNALLDILAETEKMIINDPKNHLNHEIRASVLTLNMLKYFRGKKFKNTK